jgi:C1A family cysteine protease
LNHKDYYLGNLG